MIAPDMSPVRVTTRLPARMRRSAGLALLVLLAAVRPAVAQTNFATLAADGGWCWFSDPRALFHNGALYFGCVRSDGHSTLNLFNLQTGRMTNLWISSLTEFDDHDACGLQVRPDNSLLALWSRHGGDTFFSYRQSLDTNPVTPADWGPELQANTVSGTTYCNPCQLAGEGGKIYSFSRDLNYNPTVFTSTNNGATWSAPALMILTDLTGTGGTRPYVKYCSDYSNRIDVLYTDAHPDNYTNSLYELYYQGGAFRKTDGTFLTNLTTLPILHDAGQRGSVVYQYSQAAQSDPNQWIPYGRAWCWELAYQTNGAPVCVFQTKVDAVTGSTWADARIYYYYARWTGTNWQKRFIAQAGRPLYNGQPDYGGGIGLDPQNVNTIYLSSDAANPFDLTTTTNVPLGNHYEIYKGVTADGGLTFTWTAITTNSTMDNCRPYVPRRFGGEPCVLWWRGTYNAYTSFYTSVVGLFTTAVPAVTNPAVPASLPPVPVEKANNTTGLNQGASWVGGSVPGPGNLALWDSKVTAANAVALGTNAGWAGITVTNPGGAVSLTAGNTLTLGMSGIDLSGASVNLTVSSGLTLGPGNQIWNVAAGRVLALNTGTFSRGTGATLNVAGTGTVSSAMTGLTDDASNSGGILGPWATVGSGTATAYATLTGGTVASYTGATAVAYNTIPTAATAATNYVITAAGSVAYGAATRTMNTLALTAGATTLTWGNSASQINLIVNGILNAGTGPLTLVQGGTGALSGVMAGTNNNRELVVNAAAAPIVLSARIIDNPAGASALTVVSSGTNAVTLSGVNTYSGGTTFNAGNLLLGNASGLGSTNGALTVNGGTLDLGNLSPTVGPATINGGVIQDGTLTATAFAANNPDSAGVSAVLAGASAPLTKSGPGLLSLTAANTYGGLTTINGGTLNCLGSLSGNVTVAGGTLGGIGTIAGAVTNQAGGSIAPGPGAGSIGTLTIRNSLTLQAGGTVLIKIDKNSDGTVNDSVAGLTGLVCGGTVVVTNIGPLAPAAGDYFPVFSATNYTGSFAAIVLPALGANLDWTNNLAVNGTLAVVSVPAPVVTGLEWSVTGTNLTLFWPTDLVNWRLQAQTNSLHTGLGTNWVDVAVTGLTNHLAVPLDAANGCVFYRLIYP